MALCLIVIFLLHVLCTDARLGSRRGSEWIQDAFDIQKSRKAVPEMFSKKPRLKKQKPVTDLLDELDIESTPEPKEADPANTEKQAYKSYKTLDPLNILNKDYDTNQFSNPLEMRDFETQHSFQHPIDMLSQNWVLVGDAVATTNFARLTPQHSGRRGVIWNKFGLHASDFQILLEINIHSRDAVSGDGFGIFLLDEAEVKRASAGDKRKYDRETYKLLLGDFYGMRSDFNGSAIIFDTFDNDNNGDNPLIFSIVNNGESNEWDFNKDLSSKRDEVKKDIDEIAAFNPMAKEIFPTECTLNYHNRESVKILIRYQKGRLHVYTDLEHTKVEGSDASKLNMWKKHAMPFALGPHAGMARMWSRLGMKPFAGDEEIPHLCLVRKIDLEKWQNPHIALSAITGQLSDNHDVLKLETKFLRKEHEIDDAKLTKVGSKKRNSGVLVKIYWFVICTISIILIGETVSEIVTIGKIYKEHRHIVKTINRLNPFIQLSYYLNFTQYLFLVFSFHWKCLLCNAPLLLIRAQKFMTNNVLLTPQRFEQPVFVYNTTYRQWLWIQLALLCLSAFYHFWRLFHT